jgi:hypothetical protein
MIYQNDLLGDSAEPRPSGPLAEEWKIPPFSVLDTRSGVWQERKAAWLSIGIEGELGRDDGLALREAISEHDFMGNLMGERGGGTSVFDPVLCELAYLWFCPEMGQVVDPFAGGSVRGVVAKMLGYKYWGCELRVEQVSANIVQAEKIFDGYDGQTENPPGMGETDLEWVVGDSMVKMEDSPECDFLFSCPPYGDLESYSDLSEDLSNMDWHAFVPAYKRIIHRGVMKMAEDSFACFVVGNFRDKKGFYRDLVGETVSAFRECGAGYYNEAVLVNMVGTAAARAGKQFRAYRKLVKLHQNILVFCKGDWKKASAKVKGNG